MFEKISKSWDLVKASARVLSQDKELVIFPIISSIAVVLVSIAFFVPTILANIADAALGDIQIVYYLALFVFYVVQYFVIFFFNTALVGAAMIRLKGGDPTVGDGFRIAFSRFLPLLGYSLIAATVGVLLRAISDRSKGLGRALISIIGFAWNVATFLVVPILAVENVGPIEAIKRSVALLKKTWGEQIVGNFGLGAFFGLIVFGVMLLGIGGAVALLIALDTVIPGLVLLALTILLLVLIGLAQSTLNGIYTAALYQYATEGQTTANFETEVVRDAFLPR
ncbi:MAG TPA: DUF6159 family protein [Anaerolineaceae bacterium]|nr:DUF6159 family protein [Anaerolineaceae bacterium]